VPAAIVLAGALSSAVAEPPSELARLLARPLSPGSIALLAEHTTQPGVPERLEAALRDPAPEVRAVAARVAHVGFVKGLAGALRQVLSTENDAEAAREEIRALAAFGPPAEDSHLMKAAARFAGRLDSDLLETLARTRQAAVIDLLLDRANSFAISHRREAELARLASRLTPEELVRYGTALLAREDPGRWRALLAAADSRRVSLPDALLAGGLRSRVPEIAGRSAWRLALLRASGRAPAANLLEGISPPQTADPDVHFAFEVARRSPGDTFVDDERWISSLAASAETLADSVGPGDPILALLSKAEREALRRRWERRNPTIKAVFWDPRPAPAPEAPGSLALRSLAGLPRGVAVDAIEVSGCRPKKDGFFGAAAMRYNVEGRPLRVTPMDVSVSKQCETASRNLFVMMLAPASALPINEGPEIFVALARKDCVGELDEAAVPPAGSPVEEPAIHRVGSDIEPPALVNRVEPQYPEDARRDGLAGVVILEAVISASGCVREVLVLKGVDPRLDFQAFKAVSQWHYRPARLEGRPVRVYLTVTVTFRLHSRR
jgi:TonB family protein